MKKNTKKHVEHIYSKYGKYINTYWDDFNDPNDDNNYYTIGQIIDLAKSGGSGTYNFSDTATGWKVDWGGTTLFTHTDIGGGSGSGVNTLNGLRGDINLDSKTTTIIITKDTTNNSLSLDFDDTAIGIVNSIKNEIVNTNQLQTTLGLTDNSTIISTPITLPSGGSGTNDYSALINKPKINGVELVGNKTSENLNLVQEEIIDQTGNVVSIIDNAGGEITLRVNDNLSSLETQLQLTENDLRLRASRSSLANDSVITAFDLKGLLQEKANYETTADKKNYSIGLASDSNQISVSIDTNKNIKAMIECNGSSVNLATTNMIPKLYRHNLSIDFDNGTFKGAVSFTILTTLATKFETLSDLTNYLGTSTTMSCSGYSVPTSGTFEIVDMFYLLSGGGQSINLNGASGPFVINSGDTTSISDLVNVIF